MYISLTYCDGPHHCPEYKPMAVFIKEIIILSRLMQASELQNILLFEQTLRQSTDLVLLLSYAYHPTTPFRRSEYECGCVMPGTIALNISVVVIQYFSLHFA